MPFNTPYESDDSSMLSDKTLLKAALRLAKVGHWEFDIATKTLSWSEQVYQIHEVPFGKTFSVEEAINFYKKEHQVLIENAVNEAIAQNEPWDLECILVTAKGCEVWVRTIGEAVLENGTPVKIRGLIQDVNEQKLQERALAEQEFRYRSMLDHTFNFVGLLDPDGTMLEANQSSLQFGGFTLEQARGENFADAPWWSTDTEVNQQIREALRKAKGGEFIRYDVEVTGAKHNMQIDFSISPIFGEDGKVKFLVPDARDITDRLETERLLNESLSQYRRFVSVAPAAVAMFDNDMRYIAASSKWIEDYNLGETELVGKNHYEVFPEILDMPEWLDSHQRVLAGEEYRSEKDKFIRDDGSVQWLKYTLLPWYEEHGKIGGLVMYTADITNEVEYQEKLSALNQVLENQVKKRTQELERLNKDMEQFVYIASHDLQEPLRAISNFAALVDTDALEGRSKFAVERIKQATKRMSELVVGLLDYSLLGKSPSCELVDLNQIIVDVTDDLQPMIEEKQAIVMAEQLPKCFVSASQMRQLFGNLIGNGLKYQRIGVPPIINIQSKKEGDNWVFSISDNGIGIEEKHQSKIFDIFTRLHTREEYPGTGIGLAMCQRIVDGHGGEIRIESNGIDGTTFHFTLPESSNEA